MQALVYLFVNMEIGIFMHLTVHTHRLSACVSVRLDVCVCVCDLIRNITSFVFKDVFKCESL